MLSKNLVRPSNSTIEQVTAKQQMLCRYYFCSYCTNIIRAYIGQESGRSFAGTKRHARPAVSFDLGDGSRRRTNAV